ncbi:hypothetical protein LCGC14_0706750 [marine sediment metagenome]|uniref:Uncharacterized protein n=1 Tax=marine sediment metagenome TaxID=412755 RepID=A0A0F9R1N5_9ZZZZ
MVSLYNKHSRSRPRDGRVWLPRHAPLVMMGCEALGTKYLQRRLHSCWGLAKTPMVNDCELSINPVSAQWRKVVKRHAKRQADRRKCLSIAFFSSIAQSGDREYLRELYKVNHTEHGKPDEFHEYRGIPTVRKEDYSAGRGTKKK